MSIFTENKIISFNDKICALGFDPEDKFLMHHLVSIKNLQLIKEALELSIPIENMNGRGKTVLDLVIEQKDVQILQIFAAHLKESGISYNYLRKAVLCSWAGGVRILLPFFDMAELLKSQGSLDLSHPTNLLHDAVYSGNLTLVRWLIQCGFDINQPTYGEKAYDYEIPPAEYYYGPEGGNETQVFYKYTFAKISPLSLVSMFHPFNRELENYLRNNSAQPFISWNCNRNKIAQMFQMY